LCILLVLCMLSQLSIRHKILEIICFICMASDHYKFDGGDDDDDDEMALPCGSN